jgi:hypothetical protein
VRRATKFQNLFYTLHQVNCSFLSEASLIFVTLLWESTTIRFVFFSSDNVARGAAAQSDENFSDNAAFRITMSVLRRLEIESTETHLAPSFSVFGSMAYDVDS